MAVKGNKKQEKEFSKTYGIAPYEVLGVNLSFKALKDLGFFVKEEDLENDRDFVGDDEGVPTVMMEFACRATTPGNRLRKFTFWLKKQNDRNKEDSEKGDLFKFINDQGVSAWSRKARTYEPLNAEYAEYFTGKDGEYNPRPCLIGEEQMMLFLRVAFPLDWKDGATLKYDTNKFFVGNFKELNQDLSNEEVKGTVLVATTIKLKESDEGLKEVETFYSYAFAPGTYYKSLLNKNFYKEEDIQAIHDKIAFNKGKKGKERKYVNPLEMLIAKMTDENYPCKELYNIGIVKDYASTDHMEASDKAVVHSETEEVDDVPFESDSSKY